ncbi:hypothetical protein KIN20_013650 [Parelaphostrongylus tenuis]|uniref:Uncharacterized protein n=1 Tax=Parelaphostrongylus tenuis TaxID=148309 RepID=A0AAD5QNQ0_PARTN|nr:hypothetical protein KIN20_013650 [Parelaphostrongylus tenuis]
MRCTTAIVEQILLLCLFFLVSPAFACGIMPAGQERRVAFIVSGFTLPVRMAWTSDPAIAAQNAEILRSETEVQSLVRNLIMHAVSFTKKSLMYWKNRVVVPASFLLLYLPFESAFYRSTLQSTSLSSNKRRHARAKGNLLYKRQHSDQRMHQARARE